MAVTHKIDPRRIHVTGLSAGGAMASAMLAAYPDVFASGAIIAGLPFGVATNPREALHAMMHGSALSAPELGDLVRNASKHDGVWPKISVWHGSADRTVAPANADAIVRQWLDLHGLPAAAMSKGEVDGYPREVWWNADGRTLVESYTITSMAHGTPLGLAANEERYGVEGAFLIEAGISSSYHIAGFFGLDRSAAPAAGGADGHSTRERRHGLDDDPGGGGTRTEPVSAPPPGARPRNLGQQSGQCPPRDHAGANRCAGLMKSAKHDPEKCAAVFRKDHAPNNRLSVLTFIALQRLSAITSRRSGTGSSSAPGRCSIRHRGRR